MHKGHNCAHKKQGGVQVSDAFRDQVVVMFVRNFLVDGPKVGSRVSLNPRGFPICDRLFQPKVGRS